MRLCDALLLAALPATVLALAVIPDDRGHFKNDLERDNPSFGSGLRGNDHSKAWLESQPTRTRPLLRRSGQGTKAHSQNKAKAQSTPQSQKNSQAQSKQQTPKKVSAPDKAQNQKKVPSQSKAQTQKKVQSQSNNQAQAKPSSQKIAPSKSRSQSQNKVQPQEKAQLQNNIQPQSKAHAEDKLQNQRQDKDLANPSGTASNAFDVLSSALSSQRHHGTKATDASASASSQDKHDQTTKKPSATASSSGSKKAAHSSHTSKSKNSLIMSTGPNGLTLGHSTDGTTLYRPTKYIPKSHKWYSNELYTSRKILPHVHVTTNASQNSQAKHFTYEGHSVKGIKLCPNTYPMGQCEYGSFNASSGRYHPKTDHPVYASDPGNGHKNKQHSSTTADAAANTHSSEHSSSNEKTASHSKPDRSKTGDSTSSNTHGKNSDSTYKTPDSSSVSSFSNSVWHSGKHGEDLKPGETTRTGTPKSEGGEPSLTMSTSAWWNTYKKHPRYTNAGVDASYSYQAFSLTYKGTTGLQDKDAARTAHAQPSETGDGSRASEGSSEQNGDESKSTKGSSGRGRKSRNRQRKRSVPKSKAQSKKGSSGGKAKVQNKLAVGSRSGSSHNPSNAYDVLSSALSSQRNHPSTPKNTGGSHPSKSKHSVITTTGPNGNPMTVTPGHTSYYRPFMHHTGVTAISDINARKNHLPLTRWIPKSDAWLSSTIGLTNPGTRNMPHVHVSEGSSARSRAKGFVYEGQSVKGGQYCQTTPGWHTEIHCPTPSLKSELSYPTSEPDWGNAPGRTATGSHMKATK